MLLLLVLLTVCAAGDVRAQDLVTRLRPHAREWERITTAEDARARTPEQLATLVAGTRSREPEIRRLAVRALGRLERPDLTDTIAALLADASPRVREQAARSLAQAATLRAPSPRAQQSVVTRLSSEKNPEVLGALGESLGRFRYANVDDARAAITQMLPLLNSGAAPQLGTLRGLYLLAARQRAVRPAFDVVESDLRGIAVTLSTAETNARRARRLAAATLVLLGRADQATLAQILNDPDPYVRREAVIDTTASFDLITRALADRSPVVRFEGVVAYGRRFAATRDCGDLIKPALDTNAHVRIAAIDVMANRCSANSGIATLLRAEAIALPAAEQGAWHVPAHALLALAERAPDMARAIVPRYAAHPNLFVRTYAANAAAKLKDTALLYKLLDDPAPNVRTAAVQGLSSVAGRAEEDRYIAQLTQDDSQLLMTAAAALGSTNRPEAALAMLDAVERLTKQRRENSRDARDSLVLAVGKIGTASLASSLRPYLQDFDPQVARHAADVLGKWTGTRPEPAPEPLPLAATPTYAEAAAMARARVTLVMANGDSIGLRLLPFDAPTNAARFYHQARSGYWDGLTLHRVEFNFVVQGGSPNANEYRGADAFSRDEVGVDNNRGTVGLSTRGHDTGDGQIFINLIDNTRLDYLYTVFAEVTRGMAGVDRMLEGAQIRKVIVTP